MAGTQKHTPNGQLTFGNATYGADSIVQMSQSLVDAMTAHEAAQAKAKDVLLALRDATAKVGPVLRAYRRFLVATYPHVLVRTLRASAMRARCDSAWSRRWGCPC
jgi:hypothetical protein